MLHGDLAPHWGLAIANYPTGGGQQPYKQQLSLCGVKGAAGLPAPLAYLMGKDSTAG